MSSAEIHLETQTFRENYCLHFQGTKYSSTVYSDNAPTSLFLIPKEQNFKNPLKGSLRFPEKVTYYLTSFLKKSSRI